jgi:hypothetical protein
LHATLDRLTRVGNASPLAAAGAPLEDVEQFIEAVETGLIRQDRDTYISAVPTLPEYLELEPDPEFRDAFNQAVRDQTSFMRTAAIVAVLAEIASELLSFGLEPGAARAASMGAGNLARGGMRAIHRRAMARIRLVTRLRQRAARTWRRFGNGVDVRELSPGVITIRINARQYGDAGRHWQRALGGPNHGGFGRIYLQREGAHMRRRWHTAGPRADYSGPGEGRALNPDEAPGASMIWEADLPPSVEMVDAVHNQALGRDIGNALRQFPQNDPNDLWEIVFEFI